MSTTIMTPDPTADQGGRDRRGDPQPPQDLQAEQAVLGGMLLSQDAIADVVEMLRDGDDFYQPKHRTIYDAIVDLFNAGKPVDPVTVGAELEKRGELHRVGGAPYLHTLIAMVPAPASAGHYADLVSEKGVARALVQAGVRLTQYGYGAAGSLGSAELLDRAQKLIDDVAKDRATSAFSFLGDDLPDMLAELDDVQAGRIPPGLPTGLTDLDEVTNGFKPGQLIVIAARPGIGKSALALVAARHAVFQEKKTVVFFSLEMSRNELIGRILSAETSIPQATLNTPGAMTAADWSKIDDKRADLEAARLVIDATANITMGEIRAKARRIKAQHGLDLIVVDYLQLMTGSGRAESRQVEVSEFSRGLKLLAKELEVPIIVLSQLNRGPEQRTDKRPMLSDLRESGAIEQDGDVVILLHRPGAYDRNDPRNGEADLILAKNRSGPTCTIAVADRLHLGDFRCLAKP